jgi:hypothetical protein
MNVTLTLEDDLVRKVRRIAAERDTTLTGIIREHLEKLAEESTSANRRRESAALERSFEEFQFKVWKRTWRRADLHERA